MNITDFIFKKKEEINFKKLLEEGATILDVRGSDEYVSGHLSGAVNVPLIMLPTGVEAHGTKDSLFITCCTSGRRSAMAKEILDKVGYKHVYDGGGWQTLKSSI